MMRFKDKVVWITGASSGIGEALCYAFNREGAKLIISSRNIEELERVKKNCRFNSDEIFVVRLDLEKYEDIPEIVESVKQKTGRIDILVNNGGISQRSLVKDTQFSVIKKLMDINYFGTVALTKEILPAMLQQKSGHIVVMSSLTGKFGTPLRSAYAASKHALIGFFDSLRSEVWQDNIKVTIVCAGYIKTNVSINALMGDGSKQNLMDDGQANGMSPDVLAQKIIKAILKNKEELISGGKETLGVLVKRLFPRFFSKMIRKSKLT